MNEEKNFVAKTISKIKSNPVTGSLILIGVVIISLSTFTDAAKKLLDLAIQETRPNLNGEWTAEVLYDWPNAKYIETFVFKGEGEEVFGIASFLQTERGILEGRVTKDKITFVTTTSESLGGKPTLETVHDYRGAIVGDDIHFVMQTKGGYSPHIPVEFIAKRALNNTNNATP